MSKYLSIDLESTGLDQDCLIVEFAAIPFCTDPQEIRKDLAISFYIKCPPFDEIKQSLNEWVQENMKDVLVKAYQEGIDPQDFRPKMQAYLESTEIKNYFGADERIIIFGKSINAIDLPFLNRDLGWEFMRKYFSHRTNDLTSNVYAWIDMKLLPPECESGSELMKFVGLGDVAHTAFEDAYNTAKMYLDLLKKFSK